jgi:hypothetical protein
MGWHYSSGIYQGIVVNIEGFYRRLLFDFIEQLNKQYGLEIEIITNDDITNIYEINSKECFIYIEREKYRDEHYSYSSVSSVSKDDDGNDSFPKYFEKVDKEYSLSEVENTAFLKLQKYFFDNTEEYVDIGVYKMGVVEY